MKEVSRKGCYEVRGSDRLCRRAVDMHYFEGCFKKLIQGKWREDCSEIR